MKVSFLLAFAGLTSIASAQAADSSESFQQPEARDALEAALPPELSSLQLENPSVVFLVNLGADGGLVQSMAVEATHYKLLEKAGERLAEIEFTPARKNGVKVPAELFVTISFYDPVQRAWQRGLGGVPMGITLNEATERRFYEMNKSGFRYGESSPANLDAPLEVIESELMLVEEADKTVETGTVVVEYFVDHNGKVCFPRIIRSDHDSLKNSVLMTLSKTRFSPPRVDGKPTFVRVRQPFNFS